jgi:uncharacterized protein (TIGR02145 family)
MLPPLSRLLAVLLALAAAPVALRSAPPPAPPLAHPLPSLDAATLARLDAALPATAATPAKPRRLLIYTRSAYDGHDLAIATANEAYTRMGRRTGAFETTVTDDPACFSRDSLRHFDAVFLNDTIGRTDDDPARRAALLEFITGGGGLLGVHGTSIAYTKNLWPAQEDWPEFGHLLGARGYAHRHGLTEEPIHVKIDDPAHPLARAFPSDGYPWTDEIFRFHAPYSRKNVRVLLSLDPARTDLSRYAPGDACLRDDHDYALAWIRSYGRGRVFYSALGHSPENFLEARSLRFHLDAVQFALGDLPAPTTPSAYLTPAVRAQERLGWRLGLEAYTFHKFTLFEALERTAALGLPYYGGLSFMQRVSADIPKNFDQNLSADELRQIRLKLEAVGVRMPVYYAQTIPSDEPAARRLFEFGRQMGFETFICEPQADQLDLLERLADEYGINIGIHNHGPDISPHTWRPEMVLALCEGRSPRIGAAPDLGYWLRLGIDPVEAARLLGKRILTVQMHDLHERGPKGHDVPWGTGAGESAAFFRELHRLGVKPTMIGLEFSRAFETNTPDVANCIEFFNTFVQELAPSAATAPAAAETVTDIDGNVYSTVRIGTQVWTTENFRATRFNDGTPIPELASADAWKTTDAPALCHYRNDPAHSKIHGPLYNWYAASSPKIAPPGWRVPTRDEQLALRAYLIAQGYNHDGTTEGNKVAKSMATPSGWPYRELDAYGKAVPDLVGMIGNNPATNNRSGYSARPTGCRWSDGSFHAGETSVYWWSTTPHEGGDHGWHTSLHTWFSSFGDNHHHKRTGFSMRLIRDTPAH